jgi:prevent-host-death family protein
MKTMTSREANQDFSRAKREAKSGPVIITERGRPANVLMTYEEYRRLTGDQRNIVDLLAMPEADDIELELPERKIDAFRDIDLT